MPKPPSIHSSTGLRQLADLRQALPVLVEVRFTRSGTSSDWHVCSTDEELDALIASVAPGHQFIAVSVERLDQAGWTKLTT